MSIPNDGTPIPSPSSGNHKRLHSLRRYTRRRAPSLADRLPLTTTHHGNGSATTPLPPRPPTQASWRRTSSTGRRQSSSTLWSIRTTLSGTSSSTTRLGLALCGLVITYMTIVVMVTRRMGDRIETAATTTTTTTTTTASSLTRHNPNRNPPPPLASPNDPAAAQFRQQLTERANQLLQSTKTDKEDQEDLASQQQQQQDQEPPPPNHIDPQNLFAITPADIRAAAPLHDNDPQHPHPTPQHILTAYLEPVDYDDWFHTIPLANRSRYTAQAALLTPQTYPRVQSCRHLLQTWPTDAEDCPVDGDPYLPWIHDVIPSADGRHVHFVAQNRRRCDTGQDDGPTLRFRQGQVALFQHVPLQRIHVTDSDANNSDEPRFQLTTHDQADADAVATRFLCRFSNNHVVPSVFHFDYDWIAFRKRYKGTFHEHDGGIKSIHTSQLLFSCPLPAEWHDAVRTGAHVQDDWTQYFVDVIPIRTPPRYGKSTRFLQPRYRADGLAGDNPGNETFDPVTAWGTQHVLPRIQDSGRWANIPICLPSLLQYEKGSTVENAVATDHGHTTDEEAVTPDPRNVHVQSPVPVKKHRMVSCLWASAGYRTRGERFAINDGQRRLLEWILYHQDVLGFEHVYLYDNSGAFTNETSLKPVADLFPDTVTYIGWPSQICNNRPNNRDSPGERSSQYAAESSCRLRFGPHVDWIGQFDIDEYLVPMGDYQSIHQLLDDWEKEDKRILSFASWRAWPRWSKIDPIVKLEGRELCSDKRPCFDLTVPTKHTILQTYNCDRFPPGKKGDKMPAEKQIYQPSYVYQHFIHYSAVTALSTLNSTEHAAQGRRFPRRAFPDPRQRFGNEQTEALMIHSKAIARQDTAGWEEWCQLSALERPKNQRGLCRLGIPWPEPWPEDPETAEHRATPDGWAYNCYVNPKVENDFVPRLQKAIEARAPMLGPQL